MNKKAQAAMEFLMTYGWAILVVLAAIGALAYFGVLSPGNLLPEKTTFKAPFLNTESAVIIWNSATNVTVQVPFTNSQGGSVNISTVTATATGTGDCVTVNGIWTDYSAEVIPNGEAFILTWECANDNSLVAGDKFKADLGFEYKTTTSGLTRVHSGEVVGKVQA